MDDSKTFREELAIQYPTLGRALWEPDPGGLYNAVQVGDVGFIRHGYFTCLFNALSPRDPPSDHPPEPDPDFPHYPQRLQPRTSDHIRTSIDHCKEFRSRDVTIMSREPNIGALGPDDDTQITFSCSGKQGALLYLPSPAEQEDTIALGDFEKWIVQNIHDCMRLAEERGLGVNRMEDIILVTGRHLAKSWVRTVFSDSRGGAQVSFVVKVSGDSVVRLEERNASGARLKFGPNGEGLPKNQCIFVRGYHVVRILNIWPRLRGLAGPAHLPGPEPEPDTHLELMSVPNDADYQDPLHTLSEYIAEQTPSCDMVLVHDDDMKCVKNAMPPLETLQPDALIGFLRDYAPTIRQFQCEFSPGNENDAEAEVEIATVATLSQNAFEAPRNDGDISHSNWTAKVLKTTRVVDSNTKVLIDDGKEARDIMQQEKRKQIRQDLRWWLSPPDSSINHNIAREAHYKGTNSWFFESSIFNKWRSSPSLLWIHGKPGSGKTVLCSGIIENIMVLRETVSACLAYFYCDFRDEEKQRCRHLVLSILSQLAAQSDLCCDILSYLHLAHDDGGRKPSDGALIQCLKEMLSLPTQGPVYLIIDAIDECPNHTGLQTSRKEVLDLIQDLVDLHLPNVHICVTSRPEIDIRTILESLTSLCISLHNQSGQTEDTMDYVSSVVHSDKMMQRWREEDRSLVIETLSGRANGMFRWVYCQLEILRQCLPPSVRYILNELPDTLDETYERVLKDINSVNREHAIRLLHCLTVAIRPLRIEELAEVLAIDFDAARPKLIPDWRSADEHEAVLSTCSSLIAIVRDGDSQVVQFSHISVKEYLTSDRLANADGDISCYHILPKSAHTIFAQACLGVLLSFDCRVDEDTVYDIPLAEYAVQHWVDHARFKGVSSRIQDAMEYFFDADKPHFEAWHRIHGIDRGWHSSSSRFASRENPLYCASLFGLYDLAKHLVVKHPEHVNARYGWTASPLTAALYGKHLQVAELLYKHGADIHVRDRMGWTLLHLSSWDGFVDTARWLLNHGADANDHGDDEGWTPLHVAVWVKQLEIVQMLLEHHADIHAQNARGEAALHLAACHYNSRFHINVLQSLLDHGADVNARDNEGSTPLHHSSFRGSGPFISSSRGSVEGTRLLLQHGANIDAENDEGDTPFMVALKAEHHEMAEFLWGLGTTLRW